MLKIDILTLFPEMFKGPFEESIVKRAQKKGLVEIKIHNLRDWAKDRRGTVDDKPYGGGVGMVMRVDIIDRALSTTGKSKTILLSPQGKVFNQKKASELAKLERLILICGHYEGVDQRVSDYLVDEEISIGDYVLTGGELPTMVLVDSVVRLVPGVLEKPEATEFESFSNYTLDAKRYTLLEAPQYTRPENYKGWKVPEILLSGDHKKIAQWRKEKSLEKTKKLRPDLLRRNH
ncbi:tRNA (guanosine(37)-N1)-methyltransferase TrmD [Candidatus Shapirobacteria bacterium CG10_big_fil_rev_8_21_14_0_10_40_9]|uniref:tRNA (guanine-N(1)-)-methyltransferase n=1 Tax=Candidatus Shapirobacteria bacterium CG10_big_fil_rev_8_21_14_0_10_40_9 TaxID=1974888 RepID=A0A2M8L2U2_9BACT|nr:MAG: tRNA (guanosine(37)-N1)-methyltransferase TrmD [Candidatus Shapirobacteria bacterium CG10_big_fil_rev_8_21_14_0_10_40_9]